MSNRLDVRRKSIKLAAKENSVRSVKRLGQIGKRNEVEKPEDQIRN